MPASDDSYQISAQVINVGKLILAGIGGFIGSTFRYAATGYVQQLSRSMVFSYGTLAVNLIGCFIIAFLSQLAESRGVFTAESRTFVFVGILGGFTTFSAFGNETMNLWRDGQSTLALANVAAHLVLGLGAVWISRALAYQIWGDIMMLPSESYRCAYSSARAIVTTESFV